MTRIRRLVPLAIVVLGAAAAAGAVSVASRSINSVPLGEVRPAYAALSFACILAFVLAYATAWWLVLRAIERRPVPFGPAVSLFFAAWVGRYVPGTIMHHGGRLVGGPRIGVSRASVAASLVYENLIAVAVSGALSMALLSVSLRGATAFRGWAPIALMAAVLSVALLHPAVLRTLIRTGSRLVRRLEALDGCVLDTGAVARLCGAYAVCALLAGLAYYLALRATPGAGGAPMTLAMAAYILGGIAGMLAIPVPGGVGVREGVAVAVLAGTVSAPAALTAAVLVRLVSVAADMLPLLIAATVFGVRRLSAMRSGARAAPYAPARTKP